MVSFACRAPGFLYIALYFFLWTESYFIRSWGFLKVIITIANGITAQVTYKANWTGSQATSTLTGGNDMALYNFAVVPEPTSVALIGIGAAMLSAITLRGKRKMSGRRQAC